jgi:hypothetical protein
VDSDEDIIENWHGTERTMVVFHITYTGADPTLYLPADGSGNATGIWAESWGVSFGAYYEWKDAELVEAGSNICAFMPETGDLTRLLGTEQEVARDDGTDPQGEKLSGDYADFSGGNINDDDSDDDIRRVLYAEYSASEDAALANTGGIRKLVRADADRFADFGESTSVVPDAGYTYEITATAQASDVKNIVIFDQLENAVSTADQSGADAGYWHGTFRGVVTKGLEEAGIAPVVYYNSNRDAKIADGSMSAQDILKDEVNGWIRAEDWIADGRLLADVQAIAVDLSCKTDGTAFVLQSRASVSFQIQMTAPDEAAFEELQKQNIFYACNDPVWYSLTTETNTAATVIGNRTKVQLCGEQNLEIIKQFPENADIPESEKESSFEFTLWQEKEDGTRTAFAYREYQLWSLDESGAWQQDTSRLYATDGNGRLELCAGQKAVFEGLAQAASLQVEEEESPYWKVDVTDSTDEEALTRTVTFENTFRPILYVSKKVLALPDGMEASDQEFTFQIFVGDEPVSNTEFWYVKNIRTDGGIPTTTGTGKTDENGEVTIRGGQTIALPAGEAGMSFVVKETGDYSDSWICISDTVSGTLSSKGSSVVFTNIYKYKDLLLTKEITHQDAEDCTQSFTFRICEVTEETDEEGQPILLPLSGYEWELTGDCDAAGNSGEGRTFGTLDKNGEFSCAFAGMTVKIKNLEAKKTYVVEETESGKYYETEGSSLVEVTMPTYSTGKSVTVTNDWLLRPLSISKTLVYDETDPGNSGADDRAFMMTAYVENELGEMNPLADYPYTITKDGSVVGTGYKTGQDGSFTLKNGETAVFADVAVAGTRFRVEEQPDEEYRQIYPADEEGNPEDVEGTIGTEGSEVNFVNGESDGLIIRKMYAGAAGDEQAAAMADALNQNQVSLVNGSSAVTLTLYVTDQAGNTEIWPQTDQDVTVIDQNSGEINTVWWEASGTFLLSPDQMLVITRNQLGEDGVSYQLEESEEDQNGIFTTASGDMYTVSQKDPADNAPVTGTPESKPLAILTNEVRTIDGSVIEKRMTLDSTDVLEGAQLIWRVEQYDGTQWKCAEGIPYVILDDSGLVSSQVQKTDDDGAILLTKTANGYPVVQFTEDEVQLNLYENMKAGDLRLVEDTENSDSTWGMLAGYGTSDDPFSYSMDVDPEQAVAFVNTNQISPVEIEKRLEGNSKETFVMVLKQVLQTDGSGTDAVTSAEQIRVSQAYSGMEYTIYDTATGEMTGSGTTDAKGRIYLKGGQYARLELPAGTLWTVQEELQPDCRLTDLAGNGSDQLTVLESNLMLIHTPAETVDMGEDLTITQEMITGDEAIYTLAGKRVQIDETGCLEIPEYVIRSGKICKVTAIGAAAFLWNDDLTEVTLPDSITSIGNFAFYECGSLQSVTLPEGLTSIEMYSFYGCSSLQSVTIPKGVTSIGWSAFEACSSLTGVTIPEGVTSIEYAVFDGCSSLTDITLPDSVTSIGYLAFDGCSSLTSLIIPEHVTEIDSNAFRNCDSLGKIIVLGKSVNEISGSPWGAENAQIIWQPNAVA